MGLINVFKDFLDNLAKADQPVPRPPAVTVLTKRPRLPLEIDTSASLPWKGIVWHHSETSDHPAINDWDGIVHYHTSYRIDGVIVSKEEFTRHQAAGEGKKFLKPWRDVAYHGGTEYVSAGSANPQKPKMLFHWGRPLSWTGAHAAVEGVSDVYNETHLGLCRIGNFDLAAPCKEMWDFDLALTRTLMDAYGILSSDVIGHREVFIRLGVPKQKECPGIHWNMDQFRSEL